uniref:Uncharacterized protein n=1 Tax=Sphaerodactylus townsendi TaxID=933632 RepID=A0ACB8GEP8_9SAUR
MFSPPSPVSVPHPHRAWPPSKEARAEMSAAAVDVTHSVPRHHNVRLASAEAGTTTGAAASAQACDCAAAAAARAHDRALGLARLGSEEGAATSSSLGYWLWEIRVFQPQYV